MQDFTQAYMKEWEYVQQQQQEQLTDEELRYYSESHSKRKNVQGGQKRDVATIAYYFGSLKYIIFFLSHLFPCHRFERLYLKKIKKGGA